MKLQINNEGVCYGSHDLAAEKRDQRWKPDNLLGFVLNMYIKFS